MLTKVAKDVAPAALKQPEAARYIGVSTATLETLRQRGEVEGFLHEPKRLRESGRLHWCYRRSELDRYIWSRQEQTRNELKANQRRSANVT